MSQKGSTDCNSKEHPTETDHVTEMDPATETKLYKRRWFILFIFFNGNLANSLQWIQYSSIADTVKEYYNVSYVAVDWLNMLYSLCYVVFTIPAMWFLKTMGLRWTALLGFIGTAVGGWIKVVAVSPGLFYLVVIGQILSGTVQCWVFGLNSEVAAMWFGPKEVATADAIGALGAQAGMLLAFLIPIYVVKGAFDVTVTTYQLKLLLYITSIHATVTALLCIVYFPAKPPMPPSKANSASLGELRKDTYLNSMKALFTNRNYLLLLVVYSVVNANASTSMSLLNQLLTEGFPNAAQKAEIAGSVFIAIGIIGAPFVAIIIDRTFKYRLMSISLLIACVISSLGFTLGVYFRNTGTVYATAAGMGLFTTGFYTFGYDYGSELAYPVPEGLSAILLTSFMSLSSLIELLIGGWLLRSYGNLSCNLFLTGLYFLVFLLSLFITASIKRRDKENTDSSCIVSKN